MAHHAPFPGLRPLRPDEAHRLRGRDALVASLVARVRAGASLVLVGPPGIGRSSLLAAGLPSALRDVPVGALDVPAYRATAGQRLVPHLVAPGGSLDAVTRTDGVVQLALVDDADALDEEGRRALQRLARDPAVRLVLVASERSLLPALDRELAEVAVEPLPPDALAATLEDAGVAWVPGLADAMVAELGDDPAALVWLQFAAMRLSATRERPDATLTHTALHALGGVRGCLTRHIGATLAARPSTEREAATALLDALVTPTGASMRPRDEVLASLPPHAASMLDALLDAGLAARAGARVGLAHPIVATAWPSSDAPRLAERALLRGAAPRGQRGPTALAVACGLASVLAARHLARTGEAAASLDRAERAVTRARGALAAQRFEVLSSRTRTLDVTDPEAALPVALAAYDEARGGRTEAAALELLRERSHVAPAQRLTRLPRVPRNHAFSPDGEVLAVTTEDGALTLWDVARMRHRARVELAAQGAGVAAFSGDGARLAVAGDGASVSLVRVADGAVERTLSACAQRAAEVMWSHDGLLLVVCEDELRAFDPTTGQPLWSRGAPLGLYPYTATDGARVLMQPRSICCAERYLPTSPADACPATPYFILDFATGETLGRTEGEPCADGPVALDPDGRGLLIGTNDDGTDFAHAAADDRRVPCTSLYPLGHDGSVACGGAGPWVVFRREGERTYRRPPAATYDITDVASGAVAYRSEVASVWDVMRGENLFSIATVPSPYGLVLAPRGDRVAADHARQGIDVWQAPPPENVAPDARRAHLLARTNLRVCRGSLAVVAVDAPPLDSPWAPASACAEASP
ncbi:MAG: hypothetical protein U0324_23970 [Polyangiales bacterium]